MIKDLNMYEDQLEVGQVKTITTDDMVNYIELLFSKSLKAQFYHDASNQKIQITFSDTDLRIPELSCELDKSTLKNMILGLQRLYKQLTSE